MTPESIGEYATALRPRYLRAGKKEKKAILEEFCLTTGYHRKSAIRLLREAGPRQSLARGRPAKYGPAVAQALKDIWEAADRVCSKRLVPFLPELVASLVQHGGLAPSEEIKAQLIALSPATIDRLLGPLRPKEPRRPYSRCTQSSVDKHTQTERAVGDPPANGPSVRVEMGGIEPPSKESDLGYATSLVGALSSHAAPPPTESRRAIRLVFRGLHRLFPRGT